MAVLFQHGRGGTAPNSFHGREDSLGLIEKGVIDKLAVQLNSCRTGCFCLLKGLNDAAGSCDLFAGGSKGGVDDWDLIRMDTELSLKPHKPDALNRTSETFGVA